MFPAAHATSICPLRYCHGAVGVLDAGAQLANVAHQEGDRVGAAVGHPVPETLQVHDTIEQGGQKSHPNSTKLTLALTKAGAGLRLLTSVTKLD